MGILNEKQENELPNFPSFIPFLPPLVSFTCFETRNHSVSFFSSIFKFLTQLSNTVTSMHHFVAELCKSQSLLCNLFLAHCWDYNLWWPSSSHCKLV